MDASKRYIGSNILLLTVSRPVSALMFKRYGAASARRFSRGMVAALVAQQVVVGIVIGRHPFSRHWPRLTLVDLMTISRGWAAAVLLGLSVSGIRGRRGVAGWTGWLALLYGAIVCDWLDGPIARQRGTSEVGALLDREADSWLTLCAAVTSATRGGLPLAIVVPPVGRYIMLCDALRTTPYSGVFSEEPAWVRPFGIAQMLVFIAALAPFRGRVTSRLVYTTARWQTPLQLGGLLLLHQRRRRV